MIETPAAKYSLGFMLAALLSATPFGISVYDMTIMEPFAICGVIGRGMVEAQKTMERGDKLNLARSVGWVGAGIVGSPFIVILFLALLHAIKYPVDAWAVIVVMCLGYAGPKGVQQLLDFVRGFIPSRINSGGGSRNGGANGIH